MSIMNRTMRLHKIEDLERHIAIDSDISTEAPLSVIDIDGSFIAECETNMVRLEALLASSKASLLLKNIECIRVSQTNLNGDNLELFIEVLSKFQSIKEINRLILEKNILTAESFVPLLRAIQTQFESVNSIYASEQSILFSNRNGQINKDLLAEFLAALQLNHTLEHIDISNPKMPALRSRHQYEQDLLLKIKETLNSPIKINNLMLFTNDEIRTNFQQFISALRLHGIQENSDTDPCFSAAVNETSHGLTEQFSQLHISTRFDQQQQPSQEHSVNAQLSSIDYKK